LLVAGTVAEPVLPRPTSAAGVTVTLLTWPLASVPNVQLTTPLVLIPLPLADTNVTVAGSVSVTTTLLALDGPKFVTDIV
jgi:hypothetical protein